MNKRFSKWEYPEIKDGQPTKYNWLVQNLDGFVLGTDTDIGSFSYINALNGVVIEDNVQVDHIVQSILSQLLIIQMVK